MKAKAVCWAATTVLLFLFNTAEAGLTCLWELKARRGIALEYQNELADKFGLERLQSEEMLEFWIKKKVLVQIPRETKTFYVDLNLDKQFAHMEEKFRYVRPQVIKFLEDRAGSYFAEFSKRLKVSETIRTPLYQAFLEGSGVSDANGELEDRRSTHLTGAVVDISKKDMSFREKRWLCNELKILKQKGLIDPINERNAFHVLVLPAYLEVKKEVQTVPPKKVKPKKKKAPTKK